MRTGWTLTLRRLRHVLAVTWAAGALAVSAEPAAAPAGKVVADFERVRATTRTAGNVQSAEVPSGDGGNHFLRLTTVDNVAPLDGRVLFTLPQDLSAGDFAGVAVRIQSVGDKPATLRWLGVDAANRVVFQRKAEVAPGDDFRDVVLPWTHWRWGESFGGSPSDIRRLGFRVEGGAELRVDDLRLIMPGETESPKDWLLRVAFARRPTRRAEADGLLVATDAVDQLTDADLARLLSRLRVLRGAVRRLFGEAVHPVDGPTPPSLLIFSRHGSFLRFFEDAGREWNVRIIPLPLPGRTVQNIGSAVFDPKQGADRPVFLHESVHVVLANDLRLDGNILDHNWLHEGLAAYVQLCVYPDAVAPGKLPELFSQPIEADGRGFEPLAELLRRRVNVAEYGQLATLVAYLAAEKPQWLPTLAEELVAGRNADQAFARCDTTVGRLEEAWLEWGRKRFVEARAADQPLLPEIEEIRALRSAK